MADVPSPYRMTDLALGGYEELSNLPKPREEASQEMQDIVTYFLQTEQGRRAMGRIAAGEDPKVVAADMRAPKSVGAVDQTPPGPQREPGTVSRQWNPSNVSLEPGHEGHMLPRQLSPEEAAAFKTQLSTTNIPQAESASLSQATSRNVVPQGTPAQQAQNYAGSVMSGNSGVLTPPAREKRDMPFYEAAKRTVLGGGNAGPTGPMPMLRSPKYKDEVEMLLPKLMTGQNEYERGLMDTLRGGQKIEAGMYSTDVRQRSDDMRMLAQGAALGVKTSLFLLENQREWDKLIMMRGHYRDMKDEAILRSKTAIEVALINARARLASSPVPAVFEESEANRILQEYVVKLENAKQEVDDAAAHLEQTQGHTNSPTLNPVNGYGPRLPPGGVKDVNTAPSPETPPIPGVETLPKTATPAKAPTTAKKPSLDPRNYSPTKKPNATAPKMVPIVVLDENGKDKGTGKIPEGNLQKAIKAGKVRLP